MKAAGKCLLDTTVVVGLLRNKMEIVRFVSSIKEVYLPIIAVGELMYGAEISSKSKVNRQTVANLVKAATILDVDMKGALCYASIKSSLKNTGTMIPENDIWIAALAKKNNLPIATCDKHFAGIEGVNVLFAN